MGLLCRDPDAAPVGSRRASCNCLETPRRRSLDTAPAPIRDTPFVGRAGQLHVVERGLPGGQERERRRRCPSPARQASARARWSGAFSARSPGRDDAIVLSGRCYENESVPYKALDGVVDDLSRHLASIPRQDVESLLPPDVAALTRVFPVLLQVHAIAAVRRDQQLGRADPFASAAAGIRRVARAARPGRRIASCSSSASTTCSGPTPTAPCCSRSCCGPRTHPAMLTLLSFRSEETAAKPFLQALLERAGRDIWSAISLDPLTEDEAQTLIGVLLPAGSMLTDDDRRRMTREAGGSPFVLEQLARYAGVQSDGSQPRADVCGDVRDAARVRSRPEARRFLETLAICGRPMASDLVCDACGVARERQSLVAMLRASRFIRSSGSSERIEAYHDRIRDVLAADIAPDAVRRNSRPHGARRWSRDRATIARRCSSTIGARETPRTRRFRPASPARRRARRSPSIAPRPSTGMRWR